MKERITLLSLLAIVALNAMAQSYIDDIYYTASDAQKVTKMSRATMKNGAKEIVFIGDDPILLNTTDTVDAATASMARSEATAIVSVPSFAMADGNYVNGFNGSLADMEYAQRIYRFHNPRIIVQIGDPAYNDIFWLDNNLWNVYIDPYNYAYVTPTWTNPYYFDYMYRPYVYGSWAWRYNPYAYWGWNSYWGWHDPYYYWGSPWYWGHHHHHYHHHYHPSHSIRPRYNYTTSGERRRETASRVDRRAAVMGTNTNTRRNAYTVLNNGRTSSSGTTERRPTSAATTQRVASSGSNARYAATATSTSRQGVSTASRTASSSANRVATSVNTGRNSYTTTTNRRGTSSAGRYNTTSSTTTYRNLTNNASNSRRSSYNTSSGSSRTYQQSSAPASRSNSSYRSSSSSSRSATASSSRSSGRTSSTSSSSRSGSRR